MWISIMDSPIPDFYESTKRSRISWMCSFVLFQPSQLRLPHEVCCLWGTKTIHWTTNPSLFSRQNTKYGLVTKIFGDALEIQRSHRKACLQCGSTSLWKTDTIYSFPIHHIDSSHACFLLFSQTDQNGPLVQWLGPWFLRYLQKSGLNSWIYVSISLSRTAVHGPFSSREIFQSEHPLG